MLNELSSTVVFERPQDETFVCKWQLACQGNIAHVIAMPNVKIEKIDGFVHELVENQPRWFPEGKVVTPCIANEIGDESCAFLQHNHA